MPQGGILDPDLMRRGNGVVEDIYELLPPDDPAGGGGGREQMDSMEPADDVTDCEMDSKWKPLILQALTAAKQARKMSDLVKRLVEQAVVTPPDWRTLMTDWMTRVTTGDQRTWSRPSRRMAAAGMYRPSTYSQVIGEIVIAVDCSGSINPDTLNMFMAHVTELCRDVQPKLIHLAYFHTTVFRVDTYENADDVSISITESGGTAFSPIFKRIDDMGLDPVCCVVLTDLECSDYGMEPAYPVLWASTTDKVAPWGRTISIK